MNEPQKTDHRSPPDGDHRGFEENSDDPRDPEARLVQGFQRALADGRLDAAFDQVDLRELARRLASRSEPIERLNGRVTVWMRQLDRRLRRVESRLAALARQAADQEEATRMICTILRDLDDPYGLGLSLDDRLALEEADRMIEDRESEE